MYIFSVEEAQRDLPKILEWWLMARISRLGGKHPVWLDRVRAIGNLGKRDPESCASMVIGYVEDCDLDDELLKPLPAQMFEKVFAPFPDSIASETGRP